MVKNLNDTRYQKRMKSRSLTPEEVKELLSIQIMDLKTIESLIANTAKGEAKFNPSDTFTLPAKKYFNEKQVLTTVGKYIFNKVVLNETLGNIIGYINREMGGDGLGWLDSEISNLVLNDTISVQEVATYIDKIQWLGFSLSKFLNSSLTTSMITTLPEVAERKEELLKQHEEAIKNGDIDVVGNIEKELLNIAKDKLKDDPGMDIYDSGSRGNFSNNYKNVAVMRGATKDYANPDKLNISTSNLSDGIPPEELPIYGDIMTAASAGRALGTRIGGYESKKISSAMQGVIIDKDGSDCGTKKFEPLELTKSNKSLYLTRYIKKGSGLLLLTEDNIGEYIGKTVQLRSPLFCIGDKYCSKCMGELYYRLGITNVGLITNKVGESITTLSMKSMHNMTIQLKEIDVFDYIS